MNFRRIDKNTVQCRMSEEEMEEYGFKIEDFFTDQDKAREFLEQLVERAEEEVGYEVEGGVVSMQLMRMPDNSLIITFSDQSPEGMNNMLNQIRHLAGSIDDETAEAIVEGLKNGEIPDVDDQAAIHTSENMDLFQKKNTVDADKENYQKHMKDLAKIRRDKEKSLISSAKVYSFDNLDGLEQFAADFYTKKKQVVSRSEQWNILSADQKGKIKDGRVSVFMSQIVGLWNNLLTPSLYGAVLQRAL